MIGSRPGVEGACAGTITDAASSNRAKPITLRFMINLLGTVIHPSCRPGFEISPPACREIPFDFDVGTAARLARSDPQRPGSHLLQAPFERPLRAIPEDFRDSRVVGHGVKNFLARF